jgi:MraZ protein
MYPGKIDEKGRLKLPTAFQQYFSAMREKKLFVTSLDHSTAQIYPIHVWRGNEKFFASYRDNLELAQNVAFMANDLGAETEMDSSGRISFSLELRRELKIEDKNVRLFAHASGRVEVLSEENYEQRKLQASKTTTADVRTLEAAGLN